MIIPTYAYTIWLVALLAITFAAGCSYGLTFARKKNRMANGKSTSRRK